MKKLSEILIELKAKDIDADIISAVEALDQSSEISKLTGDLEAERGKNAGILSDKKKYKERAEASELKLKEIETSKLPEDERREKEMLELKEKLVGEQKQREVDKAEFAKTQREAKLADLTGSIRWAEGTPHDTAKLIISKALSSVEDLTDSAKVEEVLSGVKDSHKSFIAAEAPSGAGGKGGSGGSGGGGEVPSIAANQAEVWGDK